MCLPQFSVSVIKCLKRKLISILDGCAGCEGYSVLAKLHTASLRLDAWCKQGLMIPEVELQPEREVGPEQTSQEQCVSLSQAPCTSGFYLKDGEKACPWMRGDNILCVSLALTKYPRGLFWDFIAHMHNDDRIILSKKKQKNSRFRGWSSLVFILVSWCIESHFIARETKKSLEQVTPNDMLPIIFWEWGSSVLEGLMHWLAYLPMFESYECLYYWYWNYTGLPIYLTNCQSLYN